MKAQDLKNSILQLAIQGKLVGQREEEGTARELLKKIDAEKLALLKAGKIKKQKALPAITEDEIPFEIPESWEWVRLIDIAYLNSGGQYKETNEGFLYIKVADMNLDENKMQIITSSRKAQCPQNSIISTGSIIFPKRGGAISTNKKRLVLKEEICIDSNTMSLTVINELLLPYINLWFGSKDLGKLATGTSVPQINNQDIYPLLVPLPPLAEQKRIVAKIEALMPYIDQYDAAYSEVEALNKKFPEDLKKSILQYAIQGKLIEQRKEEGTAEELYQQIQAEKQKLIKEGKIKKTKALPAITEDEIPFDIPESWKWVRLGDLSKNIHYGYTTSAKEVGNYKFLRITDIQNDKVEWETVPFCDVKEKDVERYGLNNRDIMIARTGGTIGKTYIVDSLEDKAVFASYLIRVIPVESIDEMFLKKFLESPFYWYQLKIGSMGTGQPNVNATTLSKLLVPVPPLKEQRRIIEELEKILPYTDY